ncbi:hypothetical protein PAECIP111891_04557 [Paenibacillus allorhizoplanae]|uniref:Uncharacterized protein n=1 Tax=Paenibacillus allorhizoplanae TaxID=2905648 RepID=A0ABN8GVN1_9BACL|nr:hypothetical protein [Paenibacillus allorhizoplanae]CAH1217127.1 hypothetical protein PAECIP111891_04557 [Paenibacillus allorhizoplanae]
MQRKKQIWLISSISLVIVYSLLLPLPMAELAVRRQMFFSLYPIESLSTKVVKSGSTSFGGAQLYDVGDISRSFIWVKKNWLGYRVIGDGTGP